MFQINRVQFTGDTAQTLKNNQFFDFPESLDLDRFCTHNPDATKYNQLCWDESQGGSNWQNPVDESTNWRGSSTTRETPILDIFTRFWNSEKSGFALMIRTWKSGRNKKSLNSPRATGTVNLKQTLIVSFIPEVAQLFVLCPGEVGEAKF